MLAVTDLLHGGAGGSADDYPAGANDFRLGTYLSRGVALTGVVDSKVGTCSFWFKRMSWAGTEYVHEMPGGWNPCWLNSDDTLRFIAHDSTGGLYVVYIGTPAIPRDGLWHHVVFAFDAATSTALVYLDGVSSKVVYGTATNTLANWTRGSHIVGRRYDTAVSFLACGLAEYYFNPKEFVDVSIPANLAKFRNAAGKPVNLGPDGSWVTGSPPAVYFRHVPDAPIADFQTNRGTGGAFSIAGGLFAEPINPSSFWTPVFSAGVYDSNTGWSGNTMRFFIYPAGIARVPPGQTQVRVTVVSDPAGNAMSFDKMHIGHSIYPTADAWDAADLTQLFFSGAPGATVPGIVGGGTLTSDAANWKYDGISAILVTAHITSLGAAARSLNPNALVYYKAGVDEAAVLNVSGYSAGGVGYCNFFNTIEML